MNRQHEASSHDDEPDLAISHIGIDLRKQSAKTRQVREDAEIHSVFALLYLG